MSKVSVPEPRYDSVTAVVQRLYWFFFGPMFLILMLLLIVGGKESQAWGSTVLYALALVLLPVVRWFEMSAGRGQTADGRPATWTDFRNYTLLVLGIGIAAIVAAHLWVLLARS